jgi:hypothetical protein
MKKRYCIDCKKEITGHSKHIKRCRLCAGLKRRDVGMERKPLKIGSIYGQLTIINITPTLKKYSKGYKRFYLCRCLCGKEKIVCKDSLLSKQTKSCGCLIKKINYKRRNPKTPINKLYKNYQNSSKIRKILFNLTLEEFRNLTSRSCYYCNQKPKQIKKSTYFTYIYNGLDRINSDLGYTIDNIVPCCKKCNYAKGNLSTNDFYHHIQQIYENIKNRI